MLARQYGCKPVISRVPYNWPLALDLLKRQYDVLFSEHTFELLTEYFEIAGTVKIEFFGVAGYFTTDPENIEAILSTRFDDWALGSRRLATYPLLGEGIFSQDGPAWKRSRELIRRLFARIQKLTPQVFTPHVDGLVSAAGNIAAPGEVVDLKPFLFEYTLNTTTDLLFGEPHSSLSKKERDAVRENYDFAAFGVGIRLRLADLAWFYNPARFRVACKDIRAWASSFADKALRYKYEVGTEEASEKYPFIIDIWEEMQDKDLVRDQLLNILVAGRDSTADLLCWTL